MPGMIIGLVLLLAGLWLRGRLLGAEHAVPEELNCTAKGLRDHFGVLSVPAGAGVIANADHLAANAAALLATVVISTVTTIAVTALIVAMHRAERAAATAQTLQ